MPIQETEKIWMDGELVNWHDAKVHVLTHSLHYGSGVFEGIRCYETDGGPAVFRLTDHVNRLFRSAKIIRMPIPYTEDVIVQAVKDLVRANNLSSCYIRPMVFRGYGEMGLDPRRSPVQVSIACWPWGSYLGGDGETEGYTAVVSSWKRHGRNIMPPAVKATGMYLNSILAKQDALEMGFDEAILLNEEGFIAECSGENIFVIKNGTLTTPPLSAGALGGMRRDAVMTIARDKGMSVVEANLCRTDLYTADEIFMTGTAAEVSPIRSVDYREVGPPGSITKDLQMTMKDVTSGRVAQYRNWVEHI